MVGTLVPGLADRAVRAQALAGVILFCNSGGELAPDRMLQGIPAMDSDPIQGGVAIR